jgi:hypothetical protein
VVLVIRDEDDVMENKNRIPMYSLNCGVVIQMMRIGGFSIGVTCTTEQPEQL